MASEAPTQVSSQAADADADAGADAGAAAKKALDHAADAQFKCAVCMEPYTEPVTTSCGHTFCGYCIAIVVLQEAAKQKKAIEKGNKPSTADTNPRCPMCREKLTGQLRENAEIRQTMIKNKVWGDKAQIFNSRICVAFDSDLDKELCFASHFRMVLDSERGIVCDIKWRDKPRENSITRLNGTWDKESGKFEGKAYTTTWQADVNSQWAKYRPQHTRGIFPSMNINRFREKKDNPWEAWEGTLKETQDGEYELVGGRFIPKDTHDRQSGGVVLMMIRASTRDSNTFDEKFRKYAKANAPAKEEASFLSSFLAAPKSTNERKERKQGGLAFAKLWAHSSPDTSAFKGETL